MIFMLFPCKNKYFKKKFAYLPALKNIQMFPATRHCLLKALFVCSPPLLLTFELIKLKVTAKVTAVPV